MRDKGLDRPLLAKYCVSEETALGDWEAGLQSVRGRPGLVDSFLHEQAQPIFTVNYSNVQVYSVRILEHDWRPLVP